MNTTRGCIQRVDAASRTAHENAASHDRRMAIGYDIAGIGKRPLELELRYAIGIESCGSRILETSIRCVGTPAGPVRTRERSIECSGLFTARLSQIQRLLRAEWFSGKKQG